MSKVKILVGLPGSGKTTYARYCEKYLKNERVSQDELFMIPSPLNIRSRIINAIIDAVSNEKNVVVDGTYIDKFRRREIVNLAKQLGAEAEMCLFDKTVEECIERNEAKKDRHKPTEDVIKEMHMMYHEPTADECDILTVIDSKWEEDHGKRLKNIVDSDDKYRKELIERVNAHRRTK